MRFIYDTDLPERIMLLRWITDEWDYYADGKHTQDQMGKGTQFERNDSELTPQLTDKSRIAEECWWFTQINQYFSRGRIGLQQGRPDFGKQQLAKMVTTAGGMIESVIRVHGPLPTPGFESGQIEGLMRMPKPGQARDIANRKLQTLITPKNICHDCSGLGHIPSACESCKGSGIDPTKASQGLVK